MPYPAFISLGSLDGTNGFVVHGALAGDNSGVAVSAGDVNGDGFDDLIIGAYNADPGSRNNTGQTAVIFGAASGLGAAIEISGLNGTNGFRINGVDAGDHSGMAVSSAGDINDDGYDDVVIGARDADSAFGEAYVVFGQASGWTDVELSTLNGTNGFRMDGSTVNWGFAGNSVSSAGDVDGDGIDDFLVGSYWQDGAGARDRGGQAYLIYGTDAGFQASYSLQNLSPTLGFTIEGRGSDFMLGYDVGSAGDVNGDGRGDLVVTSAVNRGQTYVIFGKARDGVASFDSNTLNGTNGFILTGNALSDASGSSVASVDINGDGYSDIATGAWGADTNGSNSGTGYVVFGKAGVWAASTSLGTLDQTTGLKIQGIAAGDFTGLAMSSAGDFNGDGFEDLLISGYRATSPGGAQAGQAYIVFGKAGGWTGGVLNLSTLDGTNGIRLDGVVAGDKAGTEVASGDINGDGLGDLIIGAYQADPVGRTGAGDTYVIYGQLPDSAVNRTGSAIGQTIHGSSFGDVLSGLGGDDVLEGHDGDDTLDGGAGDDTLNGGAGNDTASYASSLGALFIDLSDPAPQDTDSAGIDLLSSIENVIGTDLEDSITGDGGANRLVGGDASDDLFGAGGDDTLVGGEGDDTMSGAGGIDTVSYAGAVSAVTVDLGATTSQNTGEGNDVLTGLENVIGSDHDDVLTGDGAANAITGGDGGDTLAGGLGDDTLAGNGGRDTADYSDAASGVGVNLQITVGQNTGEGQDKLTGIENLIGSDFADLLTGNFMGNVLDGGDGADWLRGVVGDDTLHGGDAADKVLGNTGDDVLSGDAGDDLVRGGDGADTLSGGLGRDRMWGSTGADVFTFDAIADSDTGKLRDLIQDFEHGVDVVDLSAIDANGADAGDAAFTWLDGAAFTGAGGELTYDVVARGIIVSADVDGDMVADFQVRLTGATTVDINDFVL